MKVDLGKLVIAIGIPILVGSISSGLVGDSMVAFAQLEKPGFAPPGWIFPVVWTILFVLMGIASYLIATARVETETAGATASLNLEEDQKNALKLYVVQLGINFFWSIIFFGMERYLLAFLWIILLWIFIVATIRAFYPISKIAAYLMVPYLLWVTYAGVLNLLIFLLN